MKISKNDMLILLACFAIPAWFLFILHSLDVQYFMALRKSGDGQVWCVLIIGELLYLISRFIRKQ